MSFIRVENVEQREVVPKCHARFIHSDNMTVSYWDLEVGAAIPAHSHPHEQVSMAIEGEYDLTVDGETRLMTPGSVAVIPSDTPHSVLAHTECRVIDVFYPVREDYRSAEVG